MMPINAPPARRAPFLLWSWAMLLVVLLSAVPSDAAARSRVVGSAFDPASVSVALNPKSSRDKLAVAAVKRPSPDTDSATAPALAPAQIALPTPSFEALAPAPPVPAASTVLPVIVRANGARAPPAA